MLFGLHVSNPNINLHFNPNRTKLRADTSTHRSIWFTYFTEFHARTMAGFLVKWDEFLTYKILSYAFSGFSASFTAKYGSFRTLRGFCSLFTLIVAISTLIVQILIVIAFSIVCLSQPIVLKKFQRVWY